MRAALAVGVALALSGCGLLRAHDDSTREAEVFHLTGSVQVDVDRHVPIVVALLRTEPGAAELVVSDHTQLFGPGDFDFVVTPGRYRIVAFEDDNGDVRFDPTEHVNSYDDFRELVVDGSHATHVALRIGETSYLDRELPTIVMGDDRTRGVAVGTVVDIDDDRIGEASGLLGAWEPVRFMQEGHAGIFQLSDHDPARTPVLFVHGFSGWGRQFDDLREGLDAERYEPWIASYPSGWTLDDVARGLRAALNEMLTLYPTRHACVVAHSMGGLVSWRMLTLGTGDLVARDVRSLVTLASPLGGHPSAADGLRMSPVVVPAWRDLAPESDYVRTVREGVLPPHIGYTLLFAFVAGQGGDGVVPLPAQLPRFAQDAATTVRGFETTHVGILSEAAARDEVRRALEACARDDDGVPVLPPQLAGAGASGPAPH